MTLYVAYNGPAPTTAALAPTSTGTAIKTHLQIATPSTRDIKVIRWGISFDGSSAATPIKVELIQTDVAATGGTAHVASGVMPYDSNAPASLMTLGTGATGYNFTTEGTITATRIADAQLIAPTSQYIYEWSLGREFMVPVSKFLRIRTTAGASVNAYCFVEWEE